MQLLLGDSATVLQTIASNSVDLVVTSPPYDNLRTYNGFTFDFEAIAQELARVLKPGGVIVWVVNDATVKGSETGSSFRQALHFMSLGLNLHDTMIWNKGKFSAVGALQTRYAPVFEYMFVFSKGKLKTFNPIKDRKNKTAGQAVSGRIRQADGTFKEKATVGKITAEFGQRFNIWDQCPEQTDVNHPAPFPVALALDHIQSWSNPGDTVLDPFLGSGTTGVAALQLGRKFIGIEISEEYLNLSKQRIEQELLNAGQP